MRFVLVFLFLLLCGDVQVTMNEWPFLRRGPWATLFAVFLFLFMVGHSVVHAVFRRCFRPARFRWWYPGFCLVFGLVPLLVLGMIEFYPRHSSQLQSTLELYRVVGVLTSAITLPYLVFYAFILLALRSPLYRDRFARAFGVTSLVPGTDRQGRTPDGASHEVASKGCLGTWRPLLIGMHHTLARIGPGLSQLQERPGAVHPVEQHPDGGESGGRLDQTVPGPNAGEQAADEDVPDLLEAKEHRGGVSRNGVHPDHGEEERPTAVASSRL